MEQTPTRVRSPAPKSNTPRRRSPFIDPDEDLSGPEIGYSEPRKIAPPIFELGAGARSPPRLAASPGTTDLPILTSLDCKIPSSVLNSPSLTPPPNVSTAVSGRVQPSSGSGPFKSPQAPPNQSPSTETIAKVKPHKKLSKSPPISTLVQKVAANVALSIISTAKTAPPQLTTYNATTNRPQQSISTMSPVRSSLIEGELVHRMYQLLSHDLTGRAFASDAAGNTETTVSSASASPASEELMPKVWSKRNPLSPGNAILRPLSTDDLPETKEDAELFLPGDGEHLWFLGFVKPWNNFNAEAIQLLSSEKYRYAFDALKSHPMSPPPAADRALNDNNHGPEILHEKFQREVLGVLQQVHTKLMDVPGMQDGKVPNEIFLGVAAEEDLGNNEYKWNPSFVIKSSRDGKGEKTRILGQVEYFGGRPGVLTWGIETVCQNPWGSLRCALGKSDRFHAHSQ
jgi:hypothetical protein